MKKAVITVMSVLLAVSAFIFAGCEANKPLPEKTAVVYGLVHNYYLGVATITVDKDSKVKDVKIDEYFMPNYWAKATTGYAGATVVGYVVDEYVFVFNAVSPVLSAKTAGSVKIPSGEVAVSAAMNELHFSKGAYAEYYINAVKANKCWVLVEGTASSNDYSFGDKYYKKGNTATQMVAGASGTMNKSDPENTYWPKANNLTDPSKNTDLGFDENLVAMIEYVKSEAFMKLNVVTAKRLTDTTSANQDLWKIGDVTTGATLTDFKDYIKLCEDAYVMAVAAQYMG